MILVGSGALLWRAAAFAVSAGKQVDAVIHPRGETMSSGTAALTCVGTDDVNELADFMDGVSDDKLVCSTGNPFIFREPILTLGLTVVNVHGGPLPEYRGLPIPAAVYAILRSEREFGVTLHRVDAGIDTGPVVDRRMFPLAEDVTLEELSVQVTQACHDIFADNLDALDRQPLQIDTARPGGGEYFGKKSLADLGEYRDHPNFVRAIDLGVFEDFYPTYAELFDSLRDRAI